MKLTVRKLGEQPYQACWQAMRDFTDARDQSTPDELWLVRHPPVFTLGQHIKREHLLDIGDIALIESDRGGQVTYHGPGQIVAYVLCDLRRMKIGVRELVSRLEQAVIDTLAHYRIKSTARRDAPGVYVDGRKIAALGLRVRRGCSFHGLAFNVDMDLEPFSRIHPCGYEGLEVTQLVDQVDDNVTLEQVEQQLLAALMRQLGYTSIHEKQNNATEDTEVTEINNRIPATNRPE